MIGAVLLVAVLAPPAVLERGVVLYEIDRGETGDDLDLRPGDVLLSWAQEDPLDGVLHEGALDHPFDLAEMEALRCPRGALVLRGLRDGQPLEAWVEPEWCSFRKGVAPRLPPEMHGEYLRVQTLSTEGRRAEAAAGWTGLAERIDPASASRCWLYSRAATERFKAREHAEGQRLAASAVRCAEPVSPGAVPVILEQEAMDLRDNGGAQEAEPVFERALEWRTRPGADPLARAIVLSRLGWARRMIGQKVFDPDEGALEVVEREAPESPLLVRLLTVRLAVSAPRSPQYAAELKERLEAIFAARGTDHSSAARAQNIMATFLADRGQRQEAEQLARSTVDWFRRRGLATEEAVLAENNLSAILLDRGDLQAADEYLRHADYLADKGGSRARIRAVVAVNRAEVLRGLGDLRGAGTLIARAVAIIGKEFPDSRQLAYVLGGEAQTLFRLGEVAAARAGFERALELGERTAPATALVAQTMVELARLERHEGRWAEAEALYRRAIATHERRAVDSISEAEAWNGLAAATHARGDTSAALDFSARAVAIVDRMRDGIAPSPDARALFASGFHGIYRDHVQWLAEQGRTAEAFDALERGRARSLLALMAERDLRLQDGLPEALEKDRRASHGELERAQSSLADLAPDAPAEEIEQGRVRLEQARQRLADIADTVRRTAPRAAEVRLPDALGASAIAALLEPGALLVSYSVGTEKTVAFALARGETPTAPPVLRAVVMPLGSSGLRARLDAFRVDAERTAPPASFRDEAAALHQLLLEPFAAEIARARRLIVSADGPLHALPFSVLRGTGGYLVERMPVQMVLSGTLYAQLVSRRRPSARSPRLVAFGDPAAAASTGLPGSRTEVRAIKALFPRSTVHVGTEATESRAKAIGHGADYLHFALHGAVDERSPLDSALLLAADGAENGRLQAWEIFEDVRLDAELVVLSACRSAAGAERAGEGIIGLTRAFQFAGARTVVASLWDAGDRSSARFMARFYQALRAGAPKADALRSAQVGAIRAGEHPVRWAGFQSHGDWR